jgi:hypothetical protein
METGPGVRPMAGPGSVTSHGVGPLIITVAGCTTTTTGPGVRAASTTGIAAGGDQRWWPLARLISHSEKAYAGIRSLITNVTHIHVTITIGTGIEIATGIRIATGAEIARETRVSTIPEINAVPVRPIGGLLADCRQKISGMATQRRNLWEKSSAGGSLTLNR